MESTPVTFKATRFAPGWGLTLLLGALLITFLSLGNWQRERADEKREQQAAFDAAPVVEFLAPEPPAWARARLTGRLDPERHFLLDNKLFGGRPGVHVLTPFETEAGDVLLVNRGWLPLPPDRSSLPPVPTPPGEVDLEGRLAPLSRPGVQIGSPVDLQADEWPQLMVYPDWERFEAVLGQRLHRQVLYLEADSPAGFEDRRWTPFTMGADRHKAYAVQWFGLALTALVTWLVLGFNFGRKTSP